MTLPVIEKNFRCPYCDKTFTRKPWYERHSCESKRRFLERNNINTITACRLYNYWMKRLVSRKREASMDNFQKVREYGLFMRLAEFSRINYLVSNFRYVDWLVKTKQKAKDWTKTSNLDKYREWIREKEDPENQIKATIRSVKKWSEENNVPVKDFFKYVPAVLALEMIRENRLLPWVLFGYKKSEDQLLSRFTQDLLYAMDDFINVSHWIDKVTKDTKVVDLVREKCAKVFDEPA